MKGRGQLEAIAGEKIDRSTIPDYFTTEFAEMVEIWVNVKRWGMPYSGGWAEQPAILLDVINMFEQAYNEFEDERLERMK